MGPVRLSSRGLGLAARRISYVGLAVLAVVWAFLRIRGALGNDSFGFDFEGTLWDAAIAIREGESPYPAPVVSEVEVGNPALYPPLLMLLVAPLTVLPWWVGLTMWSVLLATAIAATLYVLDVRDARCYLFALLSAPAIIGIVWGNATLLLVPVVALAWRWRDRWVRTGVLIGFAIAAKLFLWPLLFWLLGTRRYRHLGVALAATCLGVLVPWAAIGFDSFTSYPDLLGVAEEVYAAHGYSVATMLAALGVEIQIASRATLALGLGIALLAFVAGRRRRDELAISLAIFAAILGSPILWVYYYAFLLIPLAIARPRFSALWVVLTLFYVTQRLPRPHLSPSELELGGAACCRPEDVPLALWTPNHAPPGLWPALGHAVLAGVILGVAVAAGRSLAEPSDSRRPFRQPNRT